MEFSFQQRKEAHQEMVLPWPDCELVGVTQYEGQGHQTCTEPSPSKACEGPRQQPMTTEELELDRIEKEKKRILKQQRKQRQMYMKIKKRANSPSMSEQVSGVVKKMSYVQKLLKKSKLLVQEKGEMVQALLLKKRLREQRQRTHKKTLTVSAPFKFRTKKRAREEGTQQSEGEFEPLVNIVGASFRWRESTAAVPYTERKLTKPKSPTLATLKRQQTRDEHSIGSMGSVDSRPFKALPLNRRMFQEAEPLPCVSKRAQTSFRPFSLSKPSNELSRRSLASYLQQKENQQANFDLQRQSFRARVLDRKIFEEPPKTTGRGTERKAATVQSPFSFLLQERMSSKKKGEEMSEDRAFKARKMPQYNFFEVKHDTHKRILFKEFNLCTNSRSQSKKRSTSEDQQHPSSQPFKALPMPAFKPKSCLKKFHPAPVKSTPFALATEDRGQEKRARFQKLVCEQMKEQTEATKFRARGVGEGCSQMKFERPAEKREIRQIEFNLSTVERSQAREAFNQRLTSKEQEDSFKKLQLQEEQRLKEEAEIKELRSQMVFKAQPIRNYKTFKPDLTQTAKPLTIPVAPQLFAFGRNTTD